MKLVHPDYEFVFDFSALSAKFVPVLLDKFFQK
mgnify:CR=1 FL=1